MFMFIFSPDSSCGVPRGVALGPSPLTHATSLTWPSRCSLIASRSHVFVLSRHPFQWHRLAVAASSAASSAAPCTRSRCLRSVARLCSFAPQCCQRQSYTANEEDWRRGMFVMTTCTCGYRVAEDVRVGVEAEVRVGDFLADDLRTRCDDEEPPSDMFSSGEERSGVSACSAT